MHLADLSYVGIVSDVKDNCGLKYSPLPVPKKSLCLVQAFKLAQMVKGRFDNLCRKGWNGAFKIFNLKLKIQILDELNAFNYFVNEKRWAQLKR